MEQDLVDDPFDADEGGGDELDDSWFIVWSIHVSSTDWLGEAVVGYYKVTCTQLDNALAEEQLELQKKYGWYLTTNNVPIILLDCFL